MPGCLKHPAASTERQEQQQQQREEQLRWLVHQATFVCGWYTVLCELEVLLPWGIWLCLPSCQQAPWQLCAGAPPVLLHSSEK